MEWRRMVEEEVKAKVDVVVRVYPPSHNQDPLLALPFHSHVLSARSSFFAARLSQRWPSAAQPPSTNTSKDNKHADAGLFAIDIVALGSSAASTYKRCIDLMYVQRKDMISCRPFSGVEDALHMLRIATELLFQDCMDACMEYLDMVCSWTPDEEASIRLTLSALQLTHIHPDLARRLSLPQAIPSNEPTLIFRRMLVQVLQASSPNLKALDPSKPIAETSIILAWNAHLDTIRKAVMEKSQNYIYSTSKVCIQDADTATSKLLWLFDKLLVLRAADAVVKAVAQDTGLSSSLAAFFKDEFGFYTIELQFSLKMRGLLTRMMESVVNGEVLLPQATRLTLIKTWLPVCGRANPMISLIGSLPVVDREQFYKDCLKPNLKGESDLPSSFLPWLGMLREAHAHLGGGCNIVLVSDDAC